MNKYKIDLLNKLKNSENWPSFSNYKFLDTLNTKADDFFNKKTLEGYISSFFIYHQLTEEIIKLLIECNNFYIKLSCLPMEIKIKFNEKMMFGQLIEELKNGVLFENKDLLINKCLDLNKKRISLAHKLTKYNSLKEIAKDAKTCKKLYNEIFNLYEIVYDDFRVIFHDIYKDYIDDFEEIEPPSPNDVRLCAVNLRYF